MKRFVIKRMLSGILLLFTVSILSFSLLYIMPIDTIDYLVEDNASEEMRD